jgi:hypothetical protein
MKNLEERIKALHQEIDAVVAAYVDARAAEVIGVPRGSVEGSILGRAGGCHCEELKIVLARLEAERKLADEQVSTG